MSTIQLRPGWGAYQPPQPEKPEKPRLDKVPKARRKEIKNILKKHIIDTDELNIRRPVKRVRVALNFIEAGLMSAGLASASRGSIIGATVFGGLAHTFHKFTQASLERVKEEAGPALNALHKAGVTKQNELVMGLDHFIKKRGDLFQATAFRKKKSNLINFIKHVKIK